jgi:phospholipid/cholesterol/gamma-HCH transport system substrate-binding protein
MRRRRGGRLSTVTIGLIALVVVLVLAFLGFTKDIPFTHGFELNATFESANNLRPNSPVRIAGVEVGKVKSITGQKGSTGAVVTMQIDKNGLPIHEDATARIRPRIFLEGNFFVDLQPGSPGSPTLDSGDTLKITQTSYPVQLDQVLTALQAPSREDLRDILDELNLALNTKPTPQQNREADPSTRGQTGAEAVNDSYVDGGRALKGTAIVNDALLGTEPDRDLARLIDGSARTSAALIVHEDQLKDLITNFNRTVAALAGESDNLSRSVALLAPTLASANRALAALNAAFPPTRAWAREILPGVRETAPTIQASFDWIDQTTRLVSPAELQGLASDLRPAVRSLATLTQESLALFPQTDLASRCARDLILPTGDEVIHDEFTTGVENYKEFFYALVGLAGEGQNTDGNGMYVRFQVGGGSQSVSLGSKSASSGELFGNNVQVPLGNRPAYPGKLPPYKPTVPCYTNKLPDVNGPAAAKSAPNGSATTAQATNVQDRLKRQADLEAVRAKLHPFGIAKRSETQAK